MLTVGAGTMVSSQTWSGRSPVTRGASQNFKADYQVMSNVWTWDSYWAVRLEDNLLLSWDGKWSAYKESELQSLPWAYYITLHHNFIPTWFSMSRNWHECYNMWALLLLSMVSVHRYCEVVVVYGCGRGSRKYCLVEYVLTFHFLLCNTTSTTAGQTTY